MPNRELSEAEATEISFGRRIGAGATAVARPRQRPRTNWQRRSRRTVRLVALLADAGSYAKPVLVFAPDNEKPGNDKPGNGKPATDKQPQISSPQISWPASSGR